MARREGNVSGFAGNLGNAADAAKAGTVRVCRLLGACFAPERPDGLQQSIQPGQASQTAGIRGPRDPRNELEPDAGRLRDSPPRPGLAVQCVARGSARLPADCRRGSAQERPSIEQNAVDRDRPTDRRRKNRCQPSLVSVTRRPKRRGCASTRPGEREPRDPTIAGPSAQVYGDGSRACEPGPPIMRRPSGCRIGLTPSFQPSQASVERRKQAEAPAPRQWPDSLHPVEPNIAPAPSMRPDRLPQISPPSRHPHIRPSLRPENAPPFRFPRICSGSRAQPPATAAANPRRSIPGHFRPERR